MFQLGEKNDSSEGSELNHEDEIKWGSKQKQSHLHMENQLGLRISVATFTTDDDGVIPTKI